MSLGSKKQKVPAQGFYALPKAYQNAYNAAMGNLEGIIGDVNADMYTPTPLTAGEQSSLEAMAQGYTPTADSLSADISMLMNPYDDYVINDINRQAQGQNSILNQALNRAGQMGSNRSILGANDIEMQRLNQIGQFRQGQYNTAVNQVLNNLVPSRRQDAAGALTAGGYQRDYDAMVNQAPVNAALAQGGLLSAFPTQFGNFGQEAYTIKSGGGLGGLVSGISSLGGLASGIGGGISAGLGASAGGAGIGSSILAGLSAFSDERLKENVKHVGGRNGFPIYEFNYKADNPFGIDPSKKYIGVMAQEVQKKRPDAVREVNGYLTVDYDAIGIEMKEVQ